MLTKLLRIPALAILPVDDGSNRIDTQKGSALSERCADGA